MRRDSDEERRRLGADSEERRVGARGARRDRWRGALFALAAVALAPGVAAAQEGAAEVARRQLVDDAQAAQDRGDHAQALALAQRAREIRMTPSLRALIAQEESALGRLVDALGNAQRCAREAEADTALSGREEVLSTCRALAAELEPRLGSVVVSVPEAEGVSVRVAGVVLAAALYGTRVPVVPGRVAIEASAPGRADFREELDVAAGQSRAIEVRLAEDAVPRAPSGGPDLTGPVVLLAAGVVVLGSSGGTFAARESAVAARDAACDEAGCDPIALSHQASALDWTIATDVLLAAGGAILAAGAVWLGVELAGGGGSGESASVALVVAPNGILLAAEGRW